MAEDDKLDALWKKIKQNQEKINRRASVTENIKVNNLQSDFMSKNQKGSSLFGNDVIGFVGKNLENGHFENENLKDANFSVANLTNVDFSKANLQGVDFTGANLTGANLSGADLSGANLSGAVLHKTNFTGAKMYGVKLVDVDLQEAILLGIDIDSITLEELQELIEYLAINYPHKLDLRKINLTMLKLSQIDLRRVSLRGVDFTGVDFTGVNIAELDLSECIITPQQIAQALGYMPNRDELAKILAPKVKKQKNWKGVDFTYLFLDDGKKFGVIDVTKDKGISIEQLMKVGKKILGKGKKPDAKEEDVVAEKKDDLQEEAKNHNEELRKVIEDRKRKELENRQQQKQKEINTQQEIKRVIDVKETMKTR